MQITLKNIKIAASLSEETTAFTATLYVDGAKRGEVSNRGHGDPIHFTDWDAQRAIEAYAHTLPRDTKHPDLFPEGFPQSAESLVSGLVAEHQISADLKRALAKRVVYTTLDGKLMQTNRYDADVLKRAVANYVEKKPFGAAQILNVLPFADALAIYRQH